MWSEILRLSDDDDHEAGGKSDVPEI
jgi:hypothetical protein